MPMQPSFIMPPPQFSGRWDEGMTTVGRPSSMYAALNARPVSSVATSPRSPRKLQPLAEASKRPIPPTPLEHFWNEHTLRNNARNLTRMVEYQVALPPVSPSDSAKLSPRAARTTSKSPRGHFNSPATVNRGPRKPIWTDATSMYHNYATYHIDTTAAPKTNARASRVAEGAALRMLQNHDMDMTKLSATARIDLERKRDASTIIAKHWRGHAARQDVLDSVVKTYGGNQVLTEALKQHVFTHFEDLASAFAYVGKDRSSLISPQELENALRRLGLPIPDRRLKQLVAACDANNDGEITYDEFVDAVYSDKMAIASIGKKKLGGRAHAAGKSTRGKRTKNLMKLDTSGLASKDATNL